MVHQLRRTDREIVEPERIEAILGGARYATVALVDDGAPYVVTLSYGHDAAARRLYFHVAHEGRKLDAIASDPRACVTVVIDHGYNDGECEHPFESVVMEGEMRIVADEAEKRLAIETLVRHLEGDAGAYWGSRSWSLDDRLAGFTALCFEIRTVVAKEGR